jgi:hypothetical protein
VHLQGLLSRDPVAQVAPQAAHPRTGAPRPRMGLYCARRILQPDQAKRTIFEHVPLYLTSLWLCVQDLPVQASVDPRSGLDTTVRVDLRTLPVPEVISHFTLVRSQRIFERTLAVEFVISEFTHVPLILKVCLPGAVHQVVLEGPFVPITV